MADKKVKRLDPAARPTDLDVIPEPSQLTTRTKAANLLVVVALAIVAISLGVFMKWAFAGEKVLDIREQPFPVRTIREHPTAAGVVFVKANYCKLQDVEGELRLSFVSSSREIFLPITREKGEKGCHNEELPILIPYEIVPDTYKIKFRVTYDVNPIKKGVTDTFETSEFIIDPTTVNTR